jgi:hypothetical protein
MRVFIYQVRRSSLDLVNLTVLLDKTDFVSLMDITDYFYNYNLGTHESSSS